MERDYKVKEAAELLGISVRTLRKRLASGAIVGRRDGRIVLISAAELQRYRSMRPKTVIRTPVPAGYEWVARKLDGTTAPERPTRRRPPRHRPGQWV